MTSEERTLRDVLAGKAMVTFLLARAGQDTTKLVWDELFENIADMSYLLADAMLKAREE